MREKPDLPLTGSPRVAEPVTLEVPNLEAAVGFFHQVLGFQIRRRGWVDGASWALLEAARVSIVLRQGTEDAPEPSGATGRSIPDLGDPILQSLFEELEKKGAS